MSDPFITKLENRELQILEIVQAYGDFYVQIKDLESSNHNFDKKLIIKLEARCDAIISFLKQTCQN